MPLLKPTKDQLLAAVGATVPDLIGPGLKVLFCGINPSLYSAVVGKHFARPGNRFWPTLFAAGFTPRRLRPDEDAEFLALGYGITNVASKATAAADEVPPDEIVRGGRALAAKVRRLEPRYLAVLGIGAYRAAFARPRAAPGPQPDPIGGTKVWVLPNPSGLNAHYTPAALAAVYAELREAVERDGPADAGSPAAPPGRVDGRSAAT